MTTKLANIVDREICTRQDFLDTYKRKHPAKQALQFLEDHSIFPLTLRNPKLTYLNLLGSYIYFSGNLRKDKNAFRVQISIPEKPILRDICEEELGLELISEHTALNTPVTRFTTNGSLYARLLYVSGVPATSGSKESRETKSSMGTCIPNYLTDIITNWETFSREKRFITRKYVRDFVTIAFETRSHPQMGGLKLHLPNQPTMKLCKQQARLFEKAYNIAFPKTEEISVRTGISKSGFEGYSSQVHFSLKKILKLTNKNRNKDSPFRIKVEIGNWPFPYKIS